MSKGLLDFDTTATSSNSNNNNNDDKETTTTTNTNSSSDGKDDKARDKRGGRDDNGGEGGDSNEKGDKSGQHKEQTSDQNDRENKETKIVEESELGNNDQGSSGEGLKLPSINMEGIAATANNATNEQLKLLKGRADNSIITIDDTNNDKDESELTESLTNDSCIVIQKESLIDSLQPSLTIDSPNLPFSPERGERTHSTERGSIHSPALLANDSRIDSAHTLEENCTQSDTSAGTQNSFRLHVSPSQSAIEPDDDTDVFVIGSSTESTKGNVLSHSPLKLSSDSIPSTTPPEPSHSIPSTTIPRYHSASLHTTTTTTGFILGLTEEEGENGDTFNDTCSSHFKLPPISAFNSESEISPSDISFTKTDGACAPLCSIDGSTSWTQTQELANASTPLTARSNVSTIASPFVSPITCLMPQGVKDISSSNPYSPLICLRHSTTVITSHVIICDEIIDRNTKKVIQTLDHVGEPSEERKVSIEATPLSSAHILNPIPTQQLSSSYVSTTEIHCPASIQSTSSISHDPVNVSHMNSSVYNQPLGQSISPLSAAASSHVVNSSCTENHLTPSTSIISSEARSQSTTPTGRIRAHSPLRSQSLDLDSLPSTSQCTTSSVVKNKSHQSGFKLVENQKVIARWKDGKWYAATIVEVSAIKAYLHFYDGDYSSVSVQHILPLACIPQGVQVSSSDTDISGSLLDFSIPDSNFRMKLSNDTIMKCSLEDLVMTADTAEMTLQLLNTQSKQVVKKRKKSVSKRPEKESLSRKESVLFNGMIFLVTDQRSSQPTGREEIEQILRERGGYIMDEYKPNLVIDNRTFCLSNTYCRTLKYLTAIAASLPCVSYEWIMECVKQGKIVSWEKDFSLFAGVSPSTKQLIKWKSHTKGFLKVNVFLSGNRTFKEIWQKVISCGGGSMISKLPRKSSKESQFTIVSESPSIPVSLKDFLIVSPDWLVECLLAGKVVSPEPFKRS